ncbi:MAG: hypothetical protein RIF41_02460 [Polyangiaceae bacterium]
MGSPGTTPPILAAWVVMSGLLAGCATPATAELTVSPPEPVPTVSETDAPPPDPTPKPDAPPPEPAAPANAPVPFEASAIRAATHPGRTYVFLVTEGDGPQKRRKIEFVKVDDEGTTMRITNQDLFGHTKGEPKDARVTWDELMSHATYPADATTITKDEVKVAAGRYESKLYTVKETKDGVAQTTRAWFALSLPGAPVKHEVEREGNVVSSMELFQHRPGSAK